MASRQHRKTASQDPRRATIWDRYESEAGAGRPESPATRGLVNPQMLAVCGTGLLHLPTGPLTELPVSGRGWRFEIGEINVLYRSGTATRMIEP